jgi:hypothetical protein
MKLKLGFILTMGLIAFIGLIQAQTPCPQCYSDKAPLAGHGTTDGRRILNYLLEVDGIV